MTNVPTPQPSPPVATRPTVSASTAMPAMIKRILPAVATRGRLLALSAVGLAGILIGLAVRNGDQIDDFAATEFISAFGLTIFVPIVALVIASATLGTLREDRTLVYFWLRPIARWQIVLAAFIAGLMILVPLAGLVMAVLAATVGDGSDVAGAIVATLVGVVAYGAMFTFLGLITKRALAWGLVYILIWEGFIGGLSRFAGRLSIRSYTTSALSRIADDPSLLTNPETTPVIIVITAALTIGFLAAATVYMNAMEVD